MRKIISIVLIILLTGFMITGCGSSNKTETVSSQDNGGNSSTETPSEVREIEEKSDTQVNVSLGQVGSSMSLPEGYPNDVIPLLDDANIVNVNDARDTISKAIGIGYMTNKSLKDAFEFYQGVMKEGTTDFESKTDDTFVLLGSKGDYVVTIGGSVTSGTVTIILDIAPKNR